MNECRDERTRKSRVAQKFIKEKKERKKERNKERKKQRKKGKSK